ncbi:hypothetical protein D3C85_1149610 [compost metagenome]
MQQHHGRAFATDPHVHRHAVDGNVLNAEGFGERHDGGMCRQVQGKQRESGEQGANHGTVSRQGRGNAERSRFRSG